MGSYYTSNCDRKMRKHTYVPNPTSLFEDENELFEVPITGHRRRHTPMRHYHSVKGRKTKSELNQQKDELEEKILDTASRCVKLLNNTEDIAITAAEELVSQGEKIHNTNRRLDEINVDLDTSQKKINGVKSVFSGFSRYFSKKNKKHLHQFSSKDDNFLHHSQSEPALSKRSIYDPPNYSSSRHKIINSGDNLDDKLEIFYDEMNSRIGHLKAIGTLIGQETENQNEVLDILAEKLTSADIRVNHQTEEIKDML